MLMPFWNVSEFFLLVTIKFKKKNAYWKKPENKGLLKKVTWRQVYMFPGIEPHEWR